MLGRGLLFLKQDKKILHYSLIKFIFYKGENHYLNHKNKQT